MAFFLTFLCVIVGTTIVDSLWTLYIEFIGKGKKMAASLMSSSIVLGQCFVITQYIEDKRLIGAAVIGGFLGVFIPMTIKEKMNAKSVNKRTTDSV